MPNGLAFQQLPAAQTQGIDPFEILNQQSQQQFEQLENLFAGEEERVYSSVQYNLNTLQQKHQIELAALQKLRRQLEPEAYQRQLISLDRKHKLQIVTAKEKIRPDVDNLNNQRQQMLQRIESGRAMKETRLNQIRDLTEKGIIQDPYAGLQEQLQILGYSVPISALRPPDPMKQAAAEARRRALEVLPTYPAAKKTATRLQRATARAVKKPGTMAEGIQKFKPSLAFRLGVPLSKTKPKYRRNKQTGETQKSINGGRTWQSIS